ETGNEDLLQDRRAQPPQLEAQPGGFPGSGALAEHDLTAGHSRGIDRKRGLLEVVLGDISASRKTGDGGRHAARLAGRVRVDDVPRPGQDVTLRISRRIRYLRLTQDARRSVGCLND